MEGLGLREQVVAWLEVGLRKKKEQLDVEVDGSITVSGPDREQEKAVGKD